MKFQISTKWTRISLLIAAMVGLSTLSFNCAPKLFEGAKLGEGDFSSAGTPGPGGTEPIAQSPYALMTSNQLFQSMLNVTDQVGAVTTVQRQEFDARTNTLSDNAQLVTISAPLQMAGTSLAGSVCDGLITKEAALAAGSRKFFPQVDFGQALSAGQSAGFNASVMAMSRSFYGRAPTSDESQILGAYFQDFVTSYGSGGTASTRKLYLSVCAAMLSSFDSLVN